MGVGWVGRLLASAVAPNCPFVRELLCAGEEEVKKVHSRVVNLCYQYSLSLSLSVKPLRSDAVAPCCRFSVLQPEPPLVSCAVGTEAPSRHSRSRRHHPSSIITITSCFCVLCFALQANYSLFKWDPSGWARTINSNTCPLAGSGHSSIWSRPFVGAVRELHSARPRWAARPPRPALELTPPLSPVARRQSPGIQGYRGLRAAPMASEASVEEARGARG